MKPRLDDRPAARPPPGWLDYAALLSVWLIIGGCVYLLMYYCPYYPDDRMPRPRDVYLWERPSLHEAQP